MFARIRRLDELDERKLGEKRGEDFKVFGGIDVEVGREDVAFEVSSEFRMKLYVSCIERRRRRKGLLLWNCEYLYRHKRFSKS